MTQAGHDLPLIISVDDHVVEPPDLWTSRLPAKYADVGPRVVRDRAKFDFSGGVFSYEKGVPDGEWCDWWLYDELVYPFPKLSAAVGFDELDVTPTTFDDIRPGCWIQSERLADMTANHVEASICFPNTLPRFCGQTFYEQGVKREGGDPELALLCVKAYNDWMIDEWCAGAPDRMIPLVLVPYWDIDASVAEAERVAAKGAKAVSFTEAPHALGLPSFHSGHWDPLMAVLNETGMPMCLHFGSGGVPNVATDAPFTTAIALFGLNSQMAAVDLVNTRLFEKYPNLKVALSEGGIGWIPYILERADYTWERHKSYTGMSDARRPSEIFRDHIFGCFISDTAGLANIDAIGVDNIMFEGDYPHSDSNWPNSRKFLEEALADVPDDQARKIAEDNARRVFNFPRS